MSYPLQLVLPTRQFEVSLGRSRYRADLPYEHASVLIGTEESDLAYHGDGRLPEQTGISRADPRWPTHSERGLAFTPEDTWNVNRERLFQLQDGQLTTMERLPTGACYEIDPQSELYRFYHHDLSREYLAQHQGRRGVYMVKLPGPLSSRYWFSPDWACNRPQGNPEKEGWTVTGTLPLITVSPSIDLKGSYHGWLGINGAPPGHLSRDLEGRGY